MQVMGMDGDGDVPDASFLSRRLWLKLTAEIRKPLNVAHFVGFIDGLLKLMELKLQTFAYLHTLKEWRFTPTSWWLRC